jgi:HK97 family phage portal protein
VIVRSFGSLEAMTQARNGLGYSPGSVPMYGKGSPQTYAALYRTQPNVRICVDFLARNFAQLGLHVFRRVSDTDRVRLADHDLVKWLGKPNPATTRYRLFEGLMQDLGIYFNAYWLKVRTADALGLVRLPPEQVSIEGGLVPSTFIWTVDGQEKYFAPSEVVHFSGYDPCNPLMGLSPLETLRQLLAEQKAASDYRQAYWTNGSRFEGVITTDKDVRYTPEQKQQFREQMQEFSASGSRAGQIPVLPAGLDLKPMSWNARDSQHYESMKLAREVCAAAFHIPQPMVGILEHATFSNVKEQHKHLYQDCLGPWLEMVGEELERQVLPECRDTRDVYVEFNIGEKLKGSFEEQAAAIVSLTGAPVLTRNEGRARLNLSAIPGQEFDTPVTPLNMGQPGAADPQSAEQNPQPEADAPPARPRRVA